MASIVVAGDTSGAITIAAPAVAGTNTITLPAATGTMLTTASTTGVNASAISTGTVAEAYGGTGTTTGYYSFKNRIINGAMQIDQRNAGASVSVSTSGVYVLDRWKNRASGGGVFSVQQSSTAPTGFNNSVIYTVTTADSSIAASDNYWIIQDIEGFNVADLQWGTANAQTVTISFWVRSSVTGTFNVGLTNGTTYDRSYVSTYTINSANTFEYKTITVAGDTTGTWGKTNGGGISLVFNLGAGSNYQATANTWSAGFLQSTSGSTNWIATNGATFYLAGVQLERGSTATSFDYRPYVNELQLCQRYYETGNYFIVSGISPNTSTFGLWGFCQFKVTKRATPTINGTVAYSNANTAVSTAYASGFQLSYNTGGVSGQSYTSYTDWSAAIEL